MSHAPILYCMSLPTTVDLQNTLGKFQNGDFAFCDETLTYYSYLFTASPPPGSYQNLFELGWWTPFSGGGPSPPSTTAYVIEQDFPYVGPMAVRDAVYVTGAGVVAQASASAMSTAPSIGLASALPAPGIVTVRYAGQLAGFAGLVPGSVYFLDTAAGGITTTAPDAVPGQVVQRLGTAATTAILVLNVSANLTML